MMIPCHGVWLRKFRSFASDFEAQHFWGNDDHPKGGERWSFSPTFQADARCASGFPSSHGGGVRSAVGKQHFKHFWGKILKLGPPGKKPIVSNWGWKTWKSWKNRAGRPCLDQRRNGEACGYQRHGRLESLSGAPSGPCRPLKGNRFHNWDNLVVATHNDQHNTLVDMQSYTGLSANRGNGIAPKWQVNGDNDERGLVIRYSSQSSICHGQNMSNFSCWGMVINLLIGNCERTTLELAPINCTAWLKAHAFVPTEENK